MTFKFKKGLMKKKYYSKSSVKSFKWTRRALTEILISQNEIPNETNKQSKLAPKI